MTFPDIETQPGSTVRLDVDVASPTVSPVDIAVDGVPDGYHAMNEREAIKVMVQP